MEENETNEALPPHHDYESLAPALLSALSNVRTDQHKVVSGFLVTANPRFKQLLNLKETHSPSLIEKNKELLDADELVSKIISRAISQEAYVESVTQQHERVKEYFEEARKQINEWIEELKNSVCNTIGCRLACHFFLKNFKEEKLKENEKFTAELKEVIGALDLDSNLKMRDEEINELRMNESLKKIDLMKSEIYNCLGWLMKGKPRPNRNGSPTNINMTKTTTFNENMQAINIQSPEEKAGVTLSAFGGGFDEFEEKEEGSEELGDDGLDEGLEEAESQAEEVMPLEAPRVYNGMKRTIFGPIVKMPGIVCSRGKGIVHISENQTSRYAAMSWEGTVVVFEEQRLFSTFVTKIKRKFAVGRADAGCCISISPNKKKLLITAKHNRNIYLIDSASLESIYQWSNTGSADLTDSTFIDDTHYAAAYADGELLIFERKRPTPKYAALPNSTPISCICLGLMSNEVYIGYSGAVGIILWDTTANASKWIKKHHQDTVSTMALAPNAKLLASGSWDYTVVVMNALNGSKILQLSDFSYYIMKIEFSNGEEKNVMVTSCNEQVLYQIKNKTEWEKCFVRKKSTEESVNIRSAVTNWYQGYSLAGNMNNNVYRSELVEAEKREEEPGVKTKDSFFKRDEKSEMNTTKT